MQSYYGFFFWGGGRLDRMKGTEAEGIVGFHR